jgi:uncharacterized protein (TIGR02145 family)
MKNLLSLFFLVLFCQSIFSQNVGIGTSNPHSSAKLEVTSNSAGFLPPRMSYTERNAINAPAQGLIIYCTDCDSSGQAQIFNGSKWTNLIGGSASAPLPTGLAEIAIGSQIWSLKNLDVTKYRNGDPIPKVTDPLVWKTLTTGAWCWYDNDSATYGATYGKLYNWYAVNDPRGLAPEGWHIPSASDWSRLIRHVDSTADTTCVLCRPSLTAGAALKNTSGWLFQVGIVTNSSGFTALPGGIRSYEGVFLGAGEGTTWWSSGQFDALNGWYRNLTNSNNSIGYYQNTKTTGFSVRVVKD